MTLPRTGLGTTSLGAVGGARGVAAGGLRILVEFISQYDPSAVKQLESDLNSLSSAEAQAASRSSAASAAVATAQSRLLAVNKQLTSEIAKQQNARGVRAEVRRIRDLGIGSVEGQAALANLRKQLGPHEKITGLLTRQAALRNGMNGLIARATNADRAHTAVMQQQLGVQQQLNAFEALKSSIPQRLSGLAIGAVGGLVGGALVGVGFEAVQAVMDGVAEKFKDIVDPSRHARESIAEVGQAVLDLAEAEGLSIRNASHKYLQQMGEGADIAAIKLLEQYAAQVLVNEAIEKYIKLVEAQAHPDAKRNEDIERLRQQLVIQAELEGRLTRRTDLRPGFTAFGVTLTNDLVTTQLIDGVDSLTVATQRYEEVERDAVAAKEASTAASARLADQNRALAASAQLAAFAEENLISALNRVGDARIAGIDSQIDNLRNAGPSKRTLDLEAKIDALRNAGDGGRRKNAELANIAEERALILLRMRLRLMGTAINLEKYSGKFLLEAINAKIAALQKEADAQDRVTKLLDLQYRASQKLRRNEGESIQDFTERQAQENRHILEETRDVEREATLARLDELKQKTQDEVALAELAERKKNALVKSGTDNRLRNLQKELEASRKADRAATDAKIKELERQKDAYRDQLETVIEYATLEKNEKIRIAISAIKRVSDIAKIGGQVSGLQAAKSFLESLLSSGVLSPADARAVSGALANINATLTKYYVHIERLNTGGGAKRPGFREATRFKEGGIIPLTNASSPFGSNVRFGEEGTEAAVILQHSIAKGLKGMNSPQQVGPFYLQSQDPLRDRYAMRQAVEDGVNRALR